MDFFQWDDELSVGNQMIDRDHLELLTLVNELHAASEQGRGDQIIVQTLQTLFTYTQEHFQREEFLMEHIDYPELEEHRAQHQKLIAQVVLLQDAMMRGRGEVASSTAELLRYWLIHHIKRTDKKLAVAIAEAGLAEL
jgi:hemerythrin